MEKFINEAYLKTLEKDTRRTFLKETFMGLGGLALGSLILDSCTKKETINNIAIDLSKPFLTRPPQFVPKAKSVIYLHMAGAPSQLELFDYKPLLQKYDGQNCPQELLEGKRFAFIKGVPKMLGSQAKFSQHGQSGAWVSDYMPHLSKVVDEISFIKSVTTEQFNHAPAQLLMHTGSARLGRPSIGSWVTYGLGSENQNLPAYVVLTSGGNNPDAGKSIWGSGFLPSVYQGVQCRSKGDPVLFLKDPNGINRDLRKASIEAINQINQEDLKTYKDPEILSRISQYEMAFKMQITVPEVMDISTEPASIHEMYGTQPGKESYANNALLARKLVEAGVRFVQVFDWGWDTHGTSEDASVNLGLQIKCKETDKATAALLIDLKQRGLLEDTLVVWGGEFGRTPMAENRNGLTQAFKGRDHHAEAFTMWMAGGGVKGGFTYGETDDMGYSVINGKVDPYDIQATILNQLGYNHEELIFEFQGRPFRLTDVAGKIIKPILA